MKTIQHEDLKERLERPESFLFLNVLPHDSYEKEHIPGSENIPYDAGDLVEKVEQKAGSKDAEIILYCASTECDASDKAGARLEKAGFTNITDFKGGMEEWKEAGYEVEGRRQAA